MQQLQHRQPNPYRSAARRRSSGLTTLVLLMFVLMGGAGAAVGTIWYLDRPQPPKQNVLVVGDNSGSKVLGCETEIAGVIDHVLRNPEPGLKPDDLTLFLLGSKDRHGEPYRAFEDEIPRLGFWGADRARRKFCDRIVEECKKAPKADQSALLQSVSRSLTHLAGRPCGQAEGPACTLWLVTDLIEEKVDLAKRAKQGIKLHNSHARITFCGFSERKMKTETDMEALQEHWRSQFSDPDLVSFLPFCPGPRS